MRSPASQLIKTGIRLFCTCIALFRRKGERPQSPRCILLVAGGYLGDTFWAIQVIPMLQRAYPDAELHLAGRSFIHVLAHGVLPERCLHDVSIVSDRMRDTFESKAMRAEAGALRRKLNPDLVFDLMCNRYSAWFCFLLKTYTVGMDLAEETSPLYSFLAEAERISSVHLACRPRSLVKQFLGEPDDADFTLLPPVPATEKKTLFAMYGFQNADKAVMLIPGAGWSAKQWQPEKYHALAQHIAEKGYRVIVSGSRKEKELCESVADGIPGSLVLCDSLSDAVSFLPHCTAVIGNDTGTVHLAEAFRIRTISLYCATNPAFACGDPACSICVVSKCPLSPGAKDPYCKVHAITCSRPEWMNISVEQVEQLLF